jgi:hypothetical protein
MNQLNAFLEWVALATILILAWSLILPSWVKWYRKRSRAPKIVCLCGSSRFSKEFQEANLRETLAGKIVLTIGCDTKTDVQLGLNQHDKYKLDLLHLRKIDMADEVLILNVGGYIGQSTGAELAYANRLGKWIRFLEPMNQPSLAGFGFQP